MIRDNIDVALKTAMRAQDKKTLTALRLITAAIKQVEVDERVVVDDVRLLVILDKMSKQRRESISQFQVANRQDLIEQEEFELSLINQFLPPPLSEQEIESLITKAIQDTGASVMADMGKVMAILKPILQGRADIGKVSTTVKSKLG